MMKLADFFAGTIKGTGAFFLIMVVSAAIFCDSIRQAVFYILAIAVGMLVYFAIVGVPATILWFFVNRKINLFIINSKLSIFVSGLISYFVLVVVLYCQNQIFNHEQFERDYGVPDYITLSVTIIPIFLASTFFIKARVKV